MARVTTDIRLTSPAFEPGQPIPQRYTADGQNQSPPLEWGDPPAGTKGFALVCEDPDAPKGLFTHWLAFNLPADARELGLGLPKDLRLADGTVQGTNGFGTVGYGGPSPPPGKPHHYIFRLSALDARLDLPPRTSRDELTTAMLDHVLAEGELVGTYGRPG
ncbi:MAG: YbhB/YbcL family Raf kinase inhibitor-like protein [Gemmataceae bacterium]